MSLRYITGNLTVLWANCTDLTYIVSNAKQIPFWSNVITLWWFEHCNIQSEMYNIINLLVKTNHVKQNYTKIIGVMAKNCEIRLRRKLKIQDILRPVSGPIHSISWEPPALMRTVNKPRSSNFANSIKVGLI